MRMKFYLLSLLTLLLSSAAIAANGGIAGSVVGKNSRNAIAGVKVMLHPGAKEVYTDANGAFEFHDITPGDYTITVDPIDFQTLQVGVRVEESIHNVGELGVTSDLYSASIDDIEFTDFDPDDGLGSQSMGAMLTASKDVFDNIAGYTFGQMRFRPRGLSQETSAIYMNGIYMNDANSGYTPWSLWSGLNDAVRDQEHVSGAGVSDYGVGGINGTTNINARASQIRKGFRFSVVNASALYRLRVMASYGSGLLDNGWSYAFTVSTRQGGNDWVKGVYYNSWGYFGSVEKRFNPHHSLAFTMFGTPGERAVQGASTQEVYDMVGSNFYNPNWGYQGGRNATDRRSSRVKNTHEPVAMLNYTFEPNSKFNLKAAVAFRFGKNGYTALDWYDAPDPRPDYYRYLPSYFDNPNPEYDDPHKEEITAWGWEWNWGIRQVDWERLHWVNSKSTFDNLITDMEANGDSFYGGVNPAGMLRSKYILEERRTDQRDLSAALQANFVLSDNSKMSMGYDFRYNRTEYYKIVKDLLGGDYWLDIDNFADRDYPDKIQNNLDTPNRLVKKGDKYGYDYYAHIYNDKFWTTYRYNSTHWKVDLGLEVGHTRFWREGLYRKALFADNSKGKSKEQNFLTYTVKGTLAYMPRGDQMIYLNFTNMQVAPYFRDAFLSPRTRNTAVSDLKNEKITSVDLNYSLRLPGFRFRLSGFYTDIRNKSKVISYYDDESRVFSNMALSGIDQQHAGMELGIEVPIIAGVSGKAAFSYGYYRYSNNPNATLTRDNTESVLLENEQVHWKDMKVEGTPQTALSLGLSYRGPHNIWAGLDANFYDAMYLSMSPLRRIDKSHMNLTHEQSIALARQERIENSWVVNANVSKSWFFKGGYNLGVSLEVKNLLNNKSIKTGGYEQMRLRRVSDGAGQPDYFKPFDSKYYYLYGTNYYLNVWIRF